MDQQCRFCGESLPHHAHQCRVPGDLDRFERIHALLDSQPDKHFLRRNLSRHLVSFGRWPAAGAIQENSATTGA